MPRMTTAEYEIYLIRAKAGDGPPPVQEASEDESALHNEIIDYCRAQKWAYFHGSMAHKTARTLGEPDFVIWGPHPKVWLIECKAKGRKLSLDQVALHAWLESLGWKVHTVFSMAEFIAVVSQ